MARKVVGIARRRTRTVPASSASSCARGIRRSSLASLLRTSGAKWRTCSNSPAVGVPRSRRARGGVPGRHRHPLTPQPLKRFVVGDPFVPLAPKCGGKEEEWDQVLTGGGKGHKVGQSGERWGAGSAEALQVASESQDRKRRQETPQRSGPTDRTTEQRRCSSAGSSARSTTKGGSSFRRRTGSGWPVGARPKADGCLAVWTPEDFEREARDGREGKRRGVGRGALRLFSGARSVKPDAQGRFAIPEDLRIFAGIEREVKVLGACEPRRDLGRRPLGSGGGRQER